MAELVKKCGVKKEEGFLYFVDKAGDISCAKASRGNKKGGKVKKVMKAGVAKEKGYLYYVDKNGDVSRSPMRNSGVEETKKAKKPVKKAAPAKPAKKAPKKK